MTFVLGYIAFAYFAGQFANAAGERFEDYLWKNTTKAERALRDFCAAYGLFLGISLGLLILLSSAQLVDVLCGQGAVRELLENELDWMGWVAIGEVFGATCYMARNYVIEYRELLGKCSNCSTWGNAFLDALRACLGQKPLVAVRAFPEDVKCPQVSDCRWRPVPTFPRGASPAPARPESVADPAPLPKSDRLGPASDA